MKKATYAAVFFAIALVLMGTGTMQAQSGIVSWDFENKTVGDSLAHIGWSTADCQTLIVSDPLAGGNKVLQNTIRNYNAAPVLLFVLPAGKTLADYAAFSFKGYFAQGDVGYKDIVVEAYQTMPTAAFVSQASAKIGSWNRAKMGSTTWEPITVDIPTTSSIKDTMYIAFGMNCSGTGDIGGTGVVTIWDADNVTLVPKTDVVTSKSVFAVSKNSLDFGSVTVGTAQKTTVTIYNRGTDTLKVTSVSATSTAFSALPSTLMIVPSDSSLFSVTFAPSDTTTQSGRILLTNNGTRGVDTILIRGKGLTRPSALPLVTNGSFENTPLGVMTGSDVQGWLIQYGSDIAPAPKFEIVGNIAQQGTHALKVTVGGVGVNQWDIQVIADSIPVKPGATYNYSVWAKAQQAGAQVNFTMGNYAYSEYKVIRPATLSTQWQNFSMQFTVTDNQTFIRGPIHFSYVGNNGNIIYLDNMRIVDANAGKLPVIVEAESGVRGSNYPVLTADNVTYVSVAANTVNTGNPGDPSRVITYQVPFADSGYYNLFARVRVGANGFDDDSYFYGNGFGQKKDTATIDWMLVNGIATAGFSDAAAFVDGPGSLGPGVWKWINLTKNGYQSTAGQPFFVSVDSLTKTFQIGGREDGMDIDKLAFARTNLYYTVGNLDSVQAGAATLQTIDSTLVWKGPALATGMDKFIGCAWDGTDANFTKYWSQVTAGNAGKFGSVATTPDSSTWNWTALDAVYTLAKTNHLLFKDHCLIWKSQQPAWLTAAGYDSAKQVTAVEQWIRMVGKRYPDMDMIDVVNEPLAGHNPAEYKNALGGAGVTGWDWVIWAFTKARQYMPKTKLLINEYGIIENTVSTSQYLEIINLLKDRKLIDGIGVQGHRFELEKADTTLFKANLNRLAATGLPIYISEFDLGNLDNAGTPNDNQQLNLYKTIFPVLWRHPGVKGITFWGYIEGSMWQSSTYLVHTDMTARPAFTWLAQYVKNNPTAVEEKISPLPASFALGQNFPNPFNPTTTIRYSIAKASIVALKVYDALGREVQTLVNTMQVPGQYAVTFNARQLSSGMYVYQLHAGTFSDTKKLMLMK